MRTILDRLGFAPVYAIDRDIAMYDLVGAVVRIERYPRMDLLVEVEGAPESIERAIELLDVPRSSFSSWRLEEFVKAYEERTGQRARISDGDDA
jgi:hypothetical protein